MSHDSNKRRGFDEEGSLQDIENARQSVNSDSPVLGITAQDGVVLVSYNAPNSSLMVTQEEDNPRCIDRVGAVFAGNEADANALLERAFKAAREEHIAYGEAADGEQIVQTIGDGISEATRDLEQRPHAATFLIADGAARTLHMVDVDGSTRQWQARAIGQRSTQLNRYLEDHYEAEGFYTDDALSMALDALSRVLGDIDTDGVSAVIVDKDDATVVGEDRIDALF